MNHTNLKILSLNCCSLRSSGKQANLLALIAEHNPDIICGCESHLDGSYSSAEVFPSNYIILRKDRLEGAGGVFLCVNASLNVSEESELDVNAEIVWAKITLPRQDSIHLCSFYRPPDSSIDPILQLQTSLNSLISRSTATHTARPLLKLNHSVLLVMYNWLKGFKCEMNGQIQYYFALLRQ